MREAFSVVLTLTPWAALLILALLAVRRLLRDRISPRCFQLAFLVLALRLAVPLDLSLPAAPVQLPDPLPREMQLEAVPQPGPAISEEVFVYTEEVSPLVRALPVLWLGGAGAFLVLHLVPYSVFRARLHRQRVPAGDAAARLAEEALGRPIRVYRVEDLPTPLLSGLLKPAIYLPAQGVSESDLPYVLAHECCHARHRDIAGQFLLLAAQAVHWFDPLVHRMARAAREDMELSCDESVLAGRSLAYRKAYGTAVLAGLSAAADRRTLTLSTGFSGGSSLKRRFTEMFHLSQKRRGLPLLALLTAIVASASVFVSCGSEEAPSQVTLAGVSAPGFTETDAAATAPQSEPAAEEAASPDGWLWPVDEAGYTYMSRALGDEHHGLDLCGQEGTPIYASRGGTVRQLPPDEDQPLPEGASPLWHPLYGCYVLVEDEEGYSTLYAHCQDVLVQPGDTVEAGEPIAAMGNTGASTGVHLHFEVHRDGQVIDPLTDLHVLLQEP